MAVKDQVIQFLVKYGFQIVGGIIIFICGLFVAGAVGRLVKKTLSRFKLEAPVELLLVRVSKLIVIIFTTILTVAKMGVDIAPLVAGMGVIGVGVGLATQGVLANLVSGLLIIFTKPFRVGEYIELVGESGVVQMIDLFSTKLSHFDKSMVVIPNRKIVGEILHNYGVIRQLDLSVGVTYDSDLRSVERTVKEVLAQNPKVLKEPAAGYGVTDLGDSSINIAIKPWVAINDFPSAPGEIYDAILEAFKARRIEMPFPQREIRILNYDAGANGPVRSVQERSVTGI
jgi:small conductance mechanosensitive channel